MGSKRLSWISLILSIIALVVGLMALVKRCPTQDLYSHFDYMGVIVGILALLVTALIGAQVGQYVFVDRKIEKIAGKISRIISRKVAQEEAREVAKEIAQKKAMEVVGSLPTDMAYVLRGKDLLKYATTESMVSEYMTAIDYTIKALNEFKQCETEALYQSTVDDTLETLKNYFEWSNKSGGFRILKGHREEYRAILNDLRSERLQVCLGYLEQAKELDKDEDNKISLREFDESFKI